MKETHVRLWSGLPSPVALWCPLSCPDSEHHLSPSTDSKNTHTYTQSQKTVHSTDPSAKQTCHIHLDISKSITAAFSDAPHDTGLMAYVKIVIYRGYTSCV